MAMYSAEDLVNWRTSLGLTQRGLADLLGMGLRAYQDLEGGQSKVRPIHVLAIERVSEKVAITEKNPMRALGPVRRDALDLAQMIRGEAG